MEGLVNSVQRQTELENEIKILRDSFSKFSQKLKFNNESIATIEEDIIEKKKTLKELNLSRKVFLFEILKYGKDCRDEGLTWIIRSIWNLGEKVYENQLPKFLDDKAKQFLLNVQITCLNPQESLQTGRNQGEADSFGHDFRHLQI